MSIPINYKSKKILCYSTECGNHIHNKPTLHPFRSGACGAMQDAPHPYCQGVYRSLSTGIKVVCVCPCHGGTGDVFKPIKEKGKKP